MDLSQIKSFIDAMAASDLREMEVSHAGWTLRLVRGARPAAPVEDAPLGTAPPADIASKPPAVAADDGRTTVRAPMFGVVHLQRAPNEPPFVQPGDLVEVGQELCTIEAMKVFNEVRAECAGRVVAVLAAPGTEIEAGAPLLVIAHV